MFDTPYKRRGRGAQSNRSGRFETLHRMDVDDGWQLAQGGPLDGCDTPAGRFDDDAPDAYGESSSSMRTQWRDAIIEAAAEAGATGANAIVLRLPHELSQLFPEWLDAHYPLKKDRVLKAIRSLRDGKLNDSDFKSRFSGQGPRADIIRQRFESACRRHGMATGQSVFNTDTSRFRRPLPPPVQPYRGQQILLF